MQTPGLTDQCMWRRNPAARLLYGDDLFRAGWNPAQVDDTLTNMTITKYNMAVFKMAVSNLSKDTEPRCCGC